MASIETARALGAEIGERSQEIESGRRLPLDLVDTLATADLFRLCVPRSLGGPEVDVQTLVDILETIAVADGSAAWCVMIGSTSALLSAYLPIEVAREIYQPKTISGGVFAPLGRALATSDGYRVSGRWPFASGCQHCSWLMGGCVVLEDGKPQLLGNGLPDVRLMLVPASEATILDTWDVAGLRGTGSHDIEIQEVFVPRHRAVSLITDLPREDGPLYRFPAFGLLALGISAVALGIARRAMTELHELSMVKTPTGSRRRLGERAAIQTDVAQSQAKLAAARALLRQTIADVWQAASDGAPLTLDQRAALRLAATHATSTSAEVVDRMYHAGGGSAVYSRSPLQRCFRDIHVATQHVMVASPTYELVGRVLLGLDADPAQL